MLPPLNDNLITLYCDNNKLNSFPTLNDKLISFQCYSNPISDSLTVINNNVNTYISNYINGNILRQIKQKIIILNNFKYLYYSLKFKNKFRNWLWVRIREPKIKKMYSPENLNILLNNMANVDDEDEFQTIINTW
jgi:hypothetical protein